MFTLDIKKKYLISSIIVLLFSLIYESFSHGVVSLYMVLAFIFPLLGFIYYKINNKSSKMFNSLLASSIATFTIGSIIKGVLDIYGTTNSLVYIYLIVGIILLIISILKKRY